MKVNLIRADIYRPWYDDVVIICILAQVSVITGGLALFDYLFVG